MSLPRLPHLYTAVAAFLAAISLAGCPQPAPDTRPQAAFTAAPRTGNVPLTVQFTNASTVKGQPIQSWNWNFGDGVFSSLPNPSHVYNVAGNYTVSLTVTSADGVDTKSVVNFIQATERSAFATIGAQGGGVSASGAMLDIPQGALRQETVFGIARDTEAFQPNAFESIVVLSPAYGITRSGEEAVVYAQGAAGGLSPATIEMRFEAQGVPAADVNSDHIQILAQLPNGQSLPIIGKINGDRIRAEVLRLPASARYAVVYRAGAFSVDVANGKILTDGNWAGGWRLHLSNELLQQLTALRVGTLQNTTPYLRRNFGTADTNQTLAELVSSVGQIQSSLGESGLRPPVLINSDGRFNLVLYDFLGIYTSDYSDFRSVIYRDSLYGNVVVDPRQLIEIARHNAAVLASDPEQVDIAQELGPANAFWQSVFEASFEGYDFPRLLGGLGSDEGPVNFVDAIRNGLAASIGQTADGLETSRSFGDNEVALLSQQLLLPFLEDVPGYSVSGQDFFRYINNRFNLNDSLEPFGDRSSDPAGLIEEVRREFAAANIGPDPTLTDALLRVYAAINRSFTAKLGSKLSQAYWLYARDVGVENSTAAQLRPSSAARPANTLNVDAFGINNIQTVTMDAPTDKKSITIEDIPPMTSRAIVVQLRPQTSELVLDFDRENWLADALGGSLNVKVYKWGAAGTELASNRDSITLRTFAEDPEDCFANVVVLVSNVNMEDSNSITIDAASFSGLTADETTVLDDYVNACDPDYSWELLSSRRVAIAGVTINKLRMTTGAWRGLEDVNQTKWTHYLTIVEPDVVASNTALLGINGGSVDSEPGDPPSGLLPFATTAQTVVALLYTVPNQPLVFDGETEERTEDEILAKSFGEYLDSYEARDADITWPALLPMTRSAVRAMDTVQDFMANYGRVRRDIQDFVVAGGSKRGWTTWLTAASDPRVRAIIPIVIDVLNMDEQMEHHFKSYGFYSSAIAPYVNENVFDRLGSAAGNSLLKIIDPITYVNRLDMPKMITNSTGDQFFLPDSSQFYFNQLPGNNYLYYAPNTDHGLGLNIDGVDNGSAKAILAWYLSLIRNIPRPTYSWAFDAENVISVTSNVTPSSVVVWSASNTTARDFRLSTIGSAWTSTELTRSNGKYTATVDFPEKGWTAFFIQLTWDGPVDSVDADFSFTTPVRVIPDTYPPAPAK